MESSHAAAVFDSTLLDFVVESVQHFIDDCHQCRKDTRNTPLKGLLPAICNVLDDRLSQLFIEMQ